MTEEIDKTLNLVKSNLLAEKDLLTQDEKGELIRLVELIPTNRGRSLPVMLEEQAGLARDLTWFLYRFRLQAKELQNAYNFAVAQTAVRVRDLDKSSGAKSTEASISARVTLDESVRNMESLSGKAEMFASLIEGLVHTSNARMRMLEQISNNSRAEAKMDAQS